jgi:hypothetical protein
VPPHPEAPSPCACAPEEQRHRVLEPLRPFAIPILAQVLKVGLVLIHVVRPRAAEIRKPMKSSGESEVLGPWANCVDQDKTSC